MTIVVAGAALKANNEVAIRARIKPILMVMYRKGQSAIALLSALALIAGGGCRSSPASSAQTPASPVKIATSPASIENTHLIAALSALTEQLRADFGDTIIPSAKMLRSVVDSMALTISSSLFMEQDAQVITTSINDYIFNQQGVVFDTNQEDVRSLFPQSVLGRKKGSCVGISLLYLCIAEKTGFPLHGVLIPRHFFVRFQHAKAHINIESMKAGAHFEDQWYTERFAISKGSWYDMHSLSEEEVKGVVLYNIGNYYRIQGRLASALELYRGSVHRLPGFAEAWGNMAITYEAMGRLDKALAALTHARDLNPKLRNIARNIGALHLRQRHFNKALAEYEGALEQSPEDPDLLYALALINFSKRNFTQAQRFAEKAIEVRTAFPEAQLLLSKISAQAK